MYVPLHLLLF